MPKIQLISALFLSLLHGVVNAETFNVAVAANFAAPIKELVTQFETTSEHKAVVSVGSTGRFYAQIQNGAPFDVLLAADSETPAKLLQENKGSQQFTYATGRLALWSKDAHFVDAEGKILTQGSISRLAIADPKLAPYGAAAIEVLQALGIESTLRTKFVQGENIGQTYQIVASGNAPLGFVALSQIYQDGKLKEGSMWLVPNAMHQAIKQDALLLNTGKDNAGARAFLNYLQSESAMKIMSGFGYTH